MTLVQTADDSFKLSAMLKSMPKLERLFIGGALATFPEELVSEDELILPSNRPIVTIPHLSRLSIEALDLDSLNNIWDIAYILSHLSLPALDHLDIKCGMSNDYSYEFGPLLPILAQNCHGPQDSAPIQAIAIASLDLLGDAEYDYMEVAGWKEGNPSAAEGAFFSRLLKNHHSRTSSARFRFCFQNVDDQAYAIGQCDRNLTATLSVLPLSHVTFLTVNIRISKFRHASWWTNIHVLFPTLNRLHIIGTVFQTFCYAFVTNKTAPAMSIDNGIPLAVHRFMKHPERRKGFFDIPSTLQELIFPGLRTLAIVDVEFEVKGLADLFIEALVARRELGVGIHNLAVSGGKFNKTYVKRLREVVPVVTWVGEEAEMEDVRGYRWMDVGSDGGKGMGDDERTWFVERRMHDEKRGRRLRE